MRVLKDSLVVLAARNEGAFLLEWLAWYRMLGFEHALVVHNDCTDHSPQLLRLLEREGVLTQKRHSPPPGTPPQPAAHVVATAHPRLRAAKWVFVCDTDEFLVVHTGDRSISALAEAIGPYAGMAINWRIYGSSGEATWHDTLVHRRFTRSATSAATQNNCYKTFFRDPTAYNRLRSHGPIGLAHGQAFGEGHSVFLLADGTPYPTYHPKRSPRNSVPDARMSHDLAQVNHYAVQSHEQYAYKKGRQSAAELKDRYTDDFFRRFDRNEMVSEVALEYRADFDAAHAALTAIPGVLRLHHLCCADYVAAMCEKRGDDPHADPRWQYHRRTAQGLPKHAQALGARSR